MHPGKLGTVGYALFLIGVALIIAGVFTGASHVALFLIFPVIYGEGLLSLLGFLLLFVGIFLIFLSPFHYWTAEERSEGYAYTSNFAENNEEYLPEISSQQNFRRKRYAGVILIGPIPIVIGSDRNMVLVALVVALIFLSLFILFLLYG